MKPAPDQLKDLYSAGARHVKIVCWPRENVCERCEQFEGSTVEAASALKQHPIPPSNCTTDFCALRYLPVIDAPGS